MLRVQQPDRALVSDAAAQDYSSTSKRSPTFDDDLLKHIATAYAEKHGSDTWCDGFAANLPWGDRPADLLWVQRTASAPPTSALLTLLARSPQAKHVKGSRLSGQRPLRAV